MLIVVLGITVFLGKGASSFLAKASSCSVNKDTVKATQVTANSAVINWETTEETQGKVEYGISSTNLSFPGIEGSSGKTHNVPLTFLTPNTVYYYIIKIGNTSCDYTGQVCDTSCIPWSFTTGVSKIAPQNANPSETPRPSVFVSPSKVPQATSTPIPSPTSIPLAPRFPTATQIPTPTSTLSPYCQRVQANIGKTTKSPDWAVVNQYDLNADGVINGADVVKCKQLGK